MKVLACLLLICIGWASSVDVTCPCGWRNSGRIVGGKETGKNEYPWMVSLNVGCGGSIITQWHVLTAAHCTIGYKPIEIIVSAGRHYQYGDNQNLQLRRVEFIYEHPVYDDLDDTSPNDLSILVLEAPWIYNTFVGPVCLPWESYDLVGKHIKVAGWGLTKGTGDDNVLREVDVQVVSNDVCRQSWRTLSYRPIQICAYTSGKDSCNGDSGGPLVYLDPETNRYTQVALVSFGPPDCGSSPKPSVNTNVYAFLDWILGIIDATRPEAQICTKDKN